MSEKSLLEQARELLARINDAALPIVSIGNLRKFLKAVIPVLELYVRDMSIEQIQKAIDASKAPKEGMTYFAVGGRGDPFAAYPLGQPAKERRTLALAQMGAMLYAADLSGIEGCIARADELMREAEKR